MRHPLALAVAVLLAACGATQDESSRDDVSDATASDTPRAVAGASTPGTVAATCGTLAPLLRVLPAARAVYGLPERYRACEPREYAVMTGFHDGGDRPSEYKFRVQLLRGDSPYAQSAVNPRGATEEQRAFLREAITRSGDLYVTRFGSCRNHATNATVPGRRKPTLATIKGVEVCFSDGFDASREVWGATATQNNLGFELELTGAKAAAIATTAEAEAHLTPLFESFLLDEATQ